MYLGNPFHNLLSICVYLLQSYAIYRLAVVRSLPNPIFAFIPFFQLFMLGQIGDSLKYLNRQVDDLFGRIPLSYTLPLLSIAGAILRYPFSSIADLVVSFGTLLVYYLIFSFYAPRQCVFFTVVCCLPTVILALSILSALPVLGVLFALAGGILSIAAIVSPIVGPLLVLYSIRGRR